MSIPSPDDPGNPVVLGRLGKTHGVKGWIRLTSYTDPPENILNYPVLGVAAGDGRRNLELDGSRQQMSGMLVHFRGYDGMETACRLSGLELFIDSEDLPALDSGDYYWLQLQGLRVMNRQGQLFGRVERLIETGANDVLVVAPVAGSIDDRERLIPYLRDRVIVDVNLADKLIRVDWDEDFLE